MKNRPAFINQHGMYQRCLASHISWYAFTHFYTCFDAFIALVFYITKTVNATNLANSHYQYPNTLASNFNY